MLSNTRASDITLADDDFDLVVSRIAALLHEDADDEDERPTQYAFQATLSLLADIRPLVGMPFPRASASTTNNRGIHVYWKRPDRMVQLAIPPCEGESAYIYHRDGEKYAVERNVSAQVLANWIRWLNDA